MAVIKLEDLVNALTYKQELPEYAGPPADGTDFIQKFELHASASNWQDAERSSAIAVVIDLSCISLV